MDVPFMKGIHLSQSDSEPDDLPQTIKQLLYDIPSVLPTREKIDKQKWTEVGCRNFYHQAFKYIYILYM